MLDPSPASGASRQAAGTARAGDRGPLRRRRAAAAQSRLRAPLSRPSPPNLKKPAGRRSVTARRARSRWLSTPTTKPRSTTCTPIKRRSDLSSQPQNSRECRQLEPFLSPAIRGGLLVEGDHQVDSRRLIDALLVACARAGVDVRHDAAGSVVVRNDVVVGVETLGGESVVRRSDRAGGRLLVGAAQRTASRCRAAGAAGERANRAAGRRHRPSAAAPQRARARARPADLSRAARRRRDRAGRHQRGEGIRHHRHRRRSRRPAGRRPRVAAPRRRDRAGRNLGRPAPRLARQRADDRAERIAGAGRSRPATTATACCSRRSPPTSSANCSAQARLPTGFDRFDPRRFAHLVSRDAVPA